MKLSPKYILIIILAAAAAVAAGATIRIRQKKTDYVMPAILKNAETGYSPMAATNLPGLSRIKHVFVIFEENHDWQEIYNNSQAPYINQSLLAEGAFAKNYHNISPGLGALRPSEPNYIMAVAGKIAFADHVFTTNDLPSTGNSTASHGHLAYLLDRNKITWKSYQEDISGEDCPIGKTENYSPKHNPFVFFHDVSGNPPANDTTYCRTHIRPLGELQNDLSAGNTADFNFISPNLVNNMHDGSINQADNWLAKIVPMISRSATFGKDGAIFITWDEGGGEANENNPIGMIVLSPFVKPGYTNSRPYTHASLLKTVEEIFHLSPLLGWSGDERTNDLADFFSDISR